MELKVTRVGSSLGVILTKEAQAHMRVGKGDILHATEAPGGAYRLTPYDPEFAAQMAVAKTVMREDRNLLRALAQ